MINKKDLHYHIVNNLPDGFACCKILWDEKGEPVDHVFEEINRAFEKMMGVSSEEILHQKLSDYLPGEKILAFSSMEDNLKGIVEQEKVLFEYYSKFLKRWYEITAYRHGVERVIVLLKDITGYKTVQFNLHNQLEFERLASDISSSLVNASFDQFDQHITRSLEHIGNYYQVDFCYVFDIDRRKENMTLSYYWMAKEADLEIDNIQFIDLKQLSWVKHHYSYLEDLCITSVDDLPFEAETEKEIMQRHGARSVLMVPMISEGYYRGILGITTSRQEMQWTNEQVSRLKVLANAISSAMSRREAEESLKESEENFRSFVENASDLIFTIDAGGVIHYMSPNITGQLGYQVSELTGVHFSELVDPEDWEQCQEAIRELLDKEELEKPVEYRIRHKEDNSYRWYSANSSALRQSADTTLFVGIARDITERKQAEEKYRLIFENAPLGVLVFDSQGYIKACNNNYVEIIGSSREDLIGCNLLDLPDQKLTAAVKEALEGKHGYYEDYYQSVTAKKVTPLRILFAPFSGKHSLSGGGMGIVEDITERKRVEEELKLSEERYREILSSVEEGYYETDLKGNITFCNESAAHIIGFSNEELMRMDYRERHKDPDYVYKVFSQVYRTGQPNRGFVMEMICKDGNTKFIELSVSPIRDELGMITGFRGISRDVSERKRYEERLKYLSLHDQLTGLYNRTYFESELKRLSESREYPVSLISVDLDGLKLVNDTLGHEKGDGLLRACAEVLKKARQSPADVLARVGGDEFVVLLPYTGKQETEGVMERIKNQVSLYNRNQEQDYIPLSLSMGMATAEEESRDLHEMFKEADDLMYRHKLHKGTGAKSQIIESLMVTLGERDFVTEGHARRLEELSRKVGEKLNLPEKKISDLVLLAQVHDLGKVGVPDRILFKKAPLNDEEWEIMRKHPEKGYRIALSSRDLAGIADLILKHHEKWDGTGYPLGIKGNEIPVECRILALADAYDAMTSDRPYRNALSHEEAVCELKACAGTQFDPELVKVFLSVFHEE